MRKSGQNIFSHCAHVCIPLNSTQLNYKSLLTACCLIDYLQMTGDSNQQIPTISVPMPGKNNSYDNIKCSFAHCHSREQSSYLLKLCLSLSISSQIYLPVQQH